MFVSLNFPMTPVDWHLGWRQPGSLGPTWHQMPLQIPDSHVFCSAILRKPNNVGHDLLGFISLCTPWLERLCEFSIRCDDTFVHRLHRQVLLRHRGQYLSPVMGVIKIDVVPLDRWRSFGSHFQLDNRFIITIRMFE